MAGNQSHADGSTGGAGGHLLDLDWDGLELDAALTLVVGWNSSGKTKLRKVNMAVNVEVPLLDVIEQNVQSLVTREAEQWAPDAVVTPETYLVMSRDGVGTRPTLARDVQDRGTFLEALRAGAGLPRMEREEVPAADMGFYALVVGNDPDNRTVFIRRLNPRRSLHRGRIFGVLSDVLARVEEPLFGFDLDVDLVLVDESLVVLSQTAFAAFFRDQDALRAQVPQWANLIGMTLPFADGSREALANKAQRDSRVRTRLEAAASRGHLAAVTIPIVTGVLEGHGIDPDTYVQDDKLVVTEETAAQLLQVLNEDLYEGPLSAARFRADRKHEL